MTVKEIFDLRKQGKIEEAYEAIRPIYRVHKGKYTTLCMFRTAADMLKLRLEQGRVEESEKIFLALKRLVPSLDDDNKKSATGFMRQAESMLIKSSEKFRKRYFAIRRAQTDRPTHAEGPLSASQTKVLDYIKSNPGLRAPMISEGLNIPSKSIERHVKALIAHGLIEHRGSKKTGGYFAL